MVPSTLTSRTDSPSTVTAVMSPSQRSSRLIVSRQCAVIVRPGDQPIRGSVVVGRIHQAGQKLLSGCPRVAGDVLRRQAAVRRGGQDRPETQSRLVGQVGPAAY